MAHLLAKTDGKYAMAYLGETPWHGLGQAMQSDSTFEEWLAASGLTYELETAEVRYEVAGNMLAMPSRRVILRNDTNKAIGVVGNGYQPVQPRTVMEFFRDLCSDMGYRLETAGALKGGAVYWAMARTPETVTLNTNGQKDTIDQFVLLSTSADGSRSTTGQFTSVRVVCNNTLSLARASTADDAKRFEKAVARIPHSTEFDADAMKRSLGLVQQRDSWTSFVDQMERLQKVTVSDAHATAWFSDLLRPAKKSAAPVIDAKQAQQSGADYLAALLADKIEVPVVAEPVEKRAIRGLDTLQQAYKSAPGAAPGTAYGLLQAATYFVDHARGKDDAEARLTSAWFGQGESLKDRALSKALELI